MDRYFKAVETDIYDKPACITYNKIYVCLDLPKGFITVIDDFGERSIYFEDRFVEVSKAEYLAQEAPQNALSSIVTNYVYQEKLEEIKRMCEALKVFNSTSLKRWKEIGFRISYEQMAGEVAAVCDIVIGIVDRDDCL